MEIVINSCHINRIITRGDKVSAQKFSIEIETRDLKQQKNAEILLDELRRDFKELDIGIKVESKGIVPEEALFIIAVTITSKVLADVFLRFLEKLWDRLKNKSISPNISNLDAVQKGAENYLLNLGILDAKITKREDRGLYVFFVFKSKKASHVIHISKSDLGIIKYTKGGP